MSPSDRNFMKTPSCRRAGTERGRVACEKSKLLLREKEAAERNAAHVREAFDRMTESYRDCVFLMSGSEARRCVSVRHPRMSSKARSVLVATIHEDGQKRRKKAKGGGQLQCVWFRRTCVVFFVG